MIPLVIRSNHIKYLKALFYKGQKRSSRSSILVASSDEVSENLILCGFQRLFIFKVKEGNH